MTDFNHSFREKIPPFDRYNYLKISDLERCPYIMFTPAGTNWAEKDNYRMLLIALDRYADELQGKRMFKCGDKVLMKYMNYIVQGEVTIARKYESKILFDGNYDLNYWYYPNTQLTKV